MTADPSFARARLLALLVPLALIIGALGSQYIGKLFPCEMCHWQRWPHYFAILIAALAFFVKSPGTQRLLVALAGLAILVSGLIGAYHAGVEYHWWAGITECTSTASGRTLEDIMNAPIVRCDVPQWTLGLISLAGFNFLISTAAALAIFAGLRRKMA